jgi:hypothetical protein
MLNKNGKGGEVAPPFDMEAVKGQLQDALNQTGNQRFIKPSELDDKTWAEVFKDLEWEVEVEVTNEQSNKDAVLTSLTTIFHDIVSNPQVLNDPNAKFLFGKILEATGSVSAIELNAPKPVQQAPATPLPKTSISYKDLPPDQQQQLAAQAGLKPSQPTPTEVAPPMGGQ